MLKKYGLFLLLIALSFAAGAQNDGYKYTEASDLTLVGKLFPDTPNPYHRVDTVKYKGFTKSENRQVRESSGISVAFRTDSKAIRIKTVFGDVENPSNTMGISANGYDLYILQDGRWLWAGSGPRNGKYDDVTVVSDLNGEMHECLLYLPTFREERFTHGVSTSRGGMTYPAQFTRNTGIQLLSLGCSGNCKMQPYFADALVDAPVDGFIFDTFSNPTVEQIRERLFPFIERMTAAHPGKPLIFQRTIYRENRNFDTASARKEEERIHFVDSLMAIACARYPDVYYIHPNATSPEHDTSVDGIHPGDYGYALWARSIEGPVLAILRKYGMELRRRYSQE